MKYLKMIGLASFASFAFSAFASACAPTVYGNDEDAFLGTDEQAAAACFLPQPMTGNNNVTKTIGREADLKSHTRNAQCDKPKVINAVSQRDISLC